jgi:hypothetical protein
MQGKSILSIASGAALFIFAASAMAAMSMPYGWYIEANGGSSHLTGKSYPGSASSSGFGGNGNLGYKFLPYIAAEMGYTRYANTSIKNGAGTRVATDKHYSYDIAAKGILPVATTGIDLFAKLGLERINSKVSVNNTAGALALGISSSSHSTTSVYVGAGGQYNLLPELALVVQWQRAQGNSSTGNEDLFSGGIAFIFG